MSINNTQSSLDKNTFEAITSFVYNAVKDSNISNVEFTIERELIITTLNGAIEKLKIPEGAGDSTNISTIEYDEFNDRILLKVVDTTKDPAIINITVGGVWRTTTTVDVSTLTTVIPTISITETQDLLVGQNSCEVSMKLSTNMFMELGVVRGVFEVTSSKLKIKSLLEVFIRTNASGVTEWTYTMKGKNTSLLNVELYAKSTELIISVNKAKTIMSSYINFGNTDVNLRRLKVISNNVPLETPLVEKVNGVGDAVKKIGNRTFELTIPDEVKFSVPSLGGGGASMPKFIGDTFKEENGIAVLTEAATNLSNNGALVSKKKLTEVVGGSVVNDMDLFWESGKLYLNVYGNGLVSKTDFKIYSGVGETLLTIGGFNYVSGSRDSMLFEITRSTPFSSLDYPIRIDLTVGVGEKNNLVKSFSKLVKLHVDRNTHPERAQAFHPTILKNINTKFRNMTTQFINNSAYKAYSTSYNYYSAYSHFDRTYIYTKVNESSSINWSDSRIQNLTFTDEDGNIHPFKYVKNMVDPYLPFMYIQKYKGNKISYQSYRKNNNTPDKPIPSMCKFGTLDVKSKDTVTAFYNIYSDGYNTRGDYDKYRSVVILRLVYHDRNTVITRDNDFAVAGDISTNKDDLIFDFSNAVDKSIDYYEVQWAPYMMETQAEIEAKLPEMTRMAQGIVDGLQEGLEFSNHMPPIKKDKLTAPFMNDLHDIINGEIGNQLVSMTGMDIHSSNASVLVPSNINNAVKLLVGYDVVNNTNTRSGWISSPFVGDNDANYAKLDSTIPEGEEAQCRNTLYQDSGIIISYLTQSSFSLHHHYVVFNSVESTNAPEYLKTIEKARIIQGLDDLSITAIISRVHAINDSRKYCNLAIKFAKSDLTYIRSVNNETNVVYTDSKFGGLDKTCPDFGFSGYDIYNPKQYVDIMTITFMTDNDITDAQLVPMVNKIYNKVFSVSSGIPGFHHTENKELLNNILNQSNLKPRLVEGIATINGVKTIINNTNVKSNWVYQGANADSQIFNTVGNLVKVKDNLKDGDFYTTLHTIDKGYNVDKFFMYSGKVKTPILYKTMIQDNIICSVIPRYIGNGIKLISTLKDCTSWDRGSLTTAAQNIQAFYSIPTTTSGKTCVSVVALMHPTAPIVRTFDNNELINIEEEFKINRAVADPANIGVVIFNIYMDEAISTADVVKVVEPLLANIGEKVDVKYLNGVVDSSIVVPDLLTSVDNVVEDNTGGYGEIYSAVFDSSTNYKGFYNVKVKRKSDGSNRAMSGNGRCFNRDFYERDGSHSLQVLDNITHDKTIDSMSGQPITLKTIGGKANNSFFSLYQGFEGTKLLIAEVDNGGTSHNENLTRKYFELDNLGINDVRVLVFQDSRNHVEGTEEVGNNYVNVWTMVFIFDNSTIITPINPTGVVWSTQVGVTIDRLNTNTAGIDIASLVFFSTDNYCYTKNQLKDIALGVITLIDGNDFT